MAELDDFDYEVKDEELVDFEGSDYGFGSDEELELEDEEEVALANEMEEEVTSLNLNEVEEEKEKTVVKRGEEPEPAPEAAAAAALAAEPERREGAESGEIEEDREEKDDGVVAQPVPSLSSVAYREGYHHERRVVESRRRHRKADLEDGELDDAAMPEGSDHEAEGNADDDDEDDKDRRERKRRKDRFAAERHSENSDRKQRESLSVMAGAARQNGSRGSDRQMDRSGGLSKAASAGGHGMMQMGGFGHPLNMAPGIMGPGGPLVPLDVGAAIPLRPVGRGYMEPLRGMPFPGAVSVSHFQDAVAVHEHMMRSHRMMQQFAQTAAGPGRPMAGPLGGPAMRPMMGLEFGGPLPRAMLHVQAQGPAMGAHMNFVGPMDAYPRNPRTSYGSGRGVPSGGSMFGQVAGRMGLSPRNGMGRQGSWPGGSMQNTDVHGVGRGRGQGRVPQVTPSVWIDPQGVAMAQAGAPQVGVSQGVGRIVDMGLNMGPGMMGTGATKMHQGPHGSLQGNHVQRDGVSKYKREPDGTWRIGVDRSISNGAQNARSGSNNRPLNNSTTRNKRERDNGREEHSSSNANSSRTASVISQGNGTITTSNVIQLGGPVQKSRLLTVSGLPENTSMSVVMEAFEKQGKVTDFRKEERGDAFTITFATVPEAITAKRHLHRSIIAGRQITVEYAVQWSDS